MNLRWKDSISLQNFYLKLSLEKLLKKLMKCSPGWKGLPVFFTNVLEQKAMWKLH